MTNDIFFSEILSENLEIQVGKAIYSARNSGNEELNYRATKLREKMQKFIRKCRQFREKKIMDPSSKQDEKFIKLGKEKDEISVEATKLLNDSSL